MKNPKIILSAILTLTLFSCGSKKYPTIPLNQLDSKLKNTGSYVAKDFIHSLNDKGIVYLLDMNYMTPVLNGGIAQFSQQYNESYNLINSIVTDITAFKLFQVVDKGEIKTMRYKLTSSNESLKFVELKLDINSLYGLRNIYLYITTKDGKYKRTNLLPEIKVRF